MSQRRINKMKLKIALILYIILTLGYLVYSTYQQSKSLSFIEGKLQDVEFVEQ
jgi:hypothetical protein